MNKNDEKFVENSNEKSLVVKEISLTDEDLSSGSDEFEEIIIKTIEKSSKVGKTSEIDEKTSEIDKIDETDEKDEIIEVLPKKEGKIKKKYIKKPPKIIKTNNPGVNVILRSRNKGTRPKKQIILYREDLEEHEDPPEIIVKSRAKGRPKKKKIIKYVDELGNEIKENKKEDATQVIIPLPGKNKELTEKDLKIIELETRLTELSQISNKNIRGTKKGKPDQRQIKPRSEKQIEQARRLVEMNKFKRLEKQKLKDEETKSNQKEAVKQVISELSNTQKENQKKEQEIKNKIIQEKKIDTYYNDPLFS